MNNTAQKVQQLFRERFGHEPVLYFSPGRINLLGEHIDYNDGFVLPAAIDKGIYFAFAPNGTDMLNFFAADAGDSYSIDVGAIEQNRGWRNYVLGVCREFILLGKKFTGFDCVFSGDLPQGAGMSSSAALEGGVAFAINDIFETRLDRKELAQLCQRAEHGYPGVKCGIMDQFANMMGEAGKAILLDCRDLSYRLLPFDFNDHVVILVNSMVHHELAAGEYNLRRQQCKEGLEILKPLLPTGSFRDLAGLSIPGAYKEAMGDTVYRRCHFVLEEMVRTQQAAVCLAENDTEGLGRLMFATHAGLSRQYEVSCPELDMLVETAANCPGVTGARMMGGGFGGCTINLVKRENAGLFKETVMRSYIRAFEKIPQFYEVDTSAGTCRITGE